MTQYLKTIRRASSAGLWGSVGVCIATAVFHFASRYRFYPTAYTAQLVLVAGSLLAVLAMSMTLLTIRKQIPAIRQTEGLEAKLKAYAQHVKSTYLTMLCVVVLICAGAAATAQNILLALAMLATLMLFLAYPNMYKMKTDLGLDDSEMQSLFGDKYISSGEQD